MSARIEEAFDYIRMNDTTPDIDRWAKHWITERTHVQSADSAVFQADLDRYFLNSDASMKEKLGESIGVSYCSFPWCEFPNIVKLL